MTRAALCRLPGIGPRAVLIGPEFVAMASRILARAWPLFSGDQASVLLRGFLTVGAWVR